MFAGRTPDHTDAPPVAPRQPTRGGGAGAGAAWTVLGAGAAMRARAADGVPLPALVKAAKGEACVEPTGHPARSHEVPHASARRHRARRHSRRAPQSHRVHRLPCSKGRCRTMGAYRRPWPVLRELPCLRLREDRLLRMPCRVAGGRVQGGGRVSGERESLGGAVRRIGFPNGRSERPPAASGSATR